MSRNQREGHYYGWAKGQHIRTDRKYRGKWNVTSWFAFRLHVQRLAKGWAKRVVSARAKNQSKGQP